MGYSFSLRFFADEKQFSPVQLVYVKVKADDSSRLKDAVKDSQIQIEAEKRKSLSKEFDHFTFALRSQEVEFVYVQ